MHTHKKLEGLVAEQVIQVVSLRIYVATGLDTNSIQLPLKDPPDSIDLARWQIPHEVQNGRPLRWQSELTIRLILIATDFGQLRICSYPSRNGDLGLCEHLCSHLAHSIFRFHFVVLAILGDVEICFVDTRTLKSWVVLGEHCTNFLGLGGVFVEVEWNVDKLWA